MTEYKNTKKQKTETKQNKINEYLENLVHYYQIVSYCSAKSVYLNVQYHDFPENLLSEKLHISSPKSNVPSFKTK